MLLKKIKADIAEINDVLTRKDGDRVGTEIDAKVEQSEFDEFKKEIKKEIQELRDEVFEKETIGPWTFSYLSWLGEIPKKEKKTTLEAKLRAIEKFLGVEYKKEEKKFEGYKPVKKVRSKK